MTAVKLSSKYQISIPKLLRDSLNLKVGERLIMLALPGRIELVPERNLADMKGVLSGMDTSLSRDEDRL